VTTQQISNGFLERWSVEKKRAQFVSWNGLAEHEKEEEKVKAKKMSKKRKKQEMSIILRRK
jgi:hypothetical protein